MNQQPHIALVMMVKNETKRLHVSLQSVLGYVDSIVIYDTGSTDNTIDILNNFSTTNNIPLRLKQGDFVDFSTSRNVLLEYVDTFMDVDFLLLLDCNDELKDGNNLRTFSKKYINQNVNTGFLIKQQWFSGQTITYFNIRLLKSRSGWRYNGSVHEWLKDTSERKDNEIIEKPSIKIDGFYLFQDRTCDDDKSSKRFERDLVLLSEEFKNKPTDTRTVFYLAQTYECLNNNNEALHYYKLRSNMEGFQEEKFHSILRLANNMVKIKMEWEDIIGTYIKAYNHSKRLEPLIEIIEYYNKIQNWELSYIFCKLALRAQYPNDAILFIDKTCYDYKRYHLLGICGFYINKFKSGRKACLEAIKTGVNVSLDTSNLNFYDKNINGPTDLGSAPSYFIRKRFRRHVPCGGDSVPLVIIPQPSKEEYFKTRYQELKNKNNNKMSDKKIKEKIRNEIKKKY